MSWFYLALLAPFLYAITNLFDDNLLQVVYKSNYLATAFAGLFGAMPLLAIIFRTPHIPLNLAMLSVLAGVLTIVYYFLYFVGLSSESPSIVIALFSLAPATLPFFAHILLHENLNELEIIGFVIVLLASLALAGLDIKRFQFSPALVPICIAVIFVDISSLLTKYIYSHSQFFSAYMFFSLGLGIGGLVCLLLKFDNNRHELSVISKKLKHLLPIFILAQGIGIAAEVTINLAISRGPVSLVRVIEGVQPMFVLVIAVALFPIAPRYFREAEDPNRLRKFALMFLAAIGLGLISVASKV